MTTIPDRLAAEERFRSVFSHLGAVAAYARRRGHADAEAAAAEVMAIAWRKLAHIPRDDPRPWLFATARNVVLADRRRARTVSAPVATASETEALELDPELDSALRSLSYVDREALLLVAWEDLTPTQAARSLAINPAAFRVRLLRARRRLRARLNEASTGRAIRAQRQPRHGDDMSNDSIMVRLRRANPVPETPAADDSGLFDRITALPQDAPVSEPRERPTRRQRRGLILVLAAVIAALLASTAFAISRWIGGDLVEPPVTRQEYFDAQKQLVLPPGVVWPKPDVAADDNSVTTRGGGGGRAVLIAMNAWECYWVDAIRRGDDAAGNERMRSSSASSRTTCSRLQRAQRRTGSPRLFPPCHSRPSPTTEASTGSARATTARPPATPEDRPELPRERSGHRPRTMREAPLSGASSTSGSSDVCCLVITLRTAWLRPLRSG